MKVTYYGHSCFSVQTAGKHLLFDPFISGNELAKDINMDAIQADYIFVSHGHFDHMLDVVAIASRTGAKVVGSWELNSYFASQGLTNLQPLNPGGQMNFNFGTVKAFIAQHSSSFQDGTYAGSASGFAFKTTEGNFYYSGDTALSYDMQLVANWTALHFAVFPVGDVLTMGIQDAIEAAKLVNADTVIGVHYDTFGFIEIDKAGAITDFKNAAKTLYLPAIGTSVEI